MMALGWLANLNHCDELDHHKLEPVRNRRIDNCQQNLELYETTKEQNAFIASGATVLNSQCGLRHTNLRTSVK